MTTTTTATMTTTPTTTVTTTLADKTALSGLSVTIPLATKPPAAAVPVTTTTTETLQPALRSTSSPPMRELYFVSTKSPSPQPRLVQNGTSSPTSPTTAVTSTATTTTAKGGKDEERTVTVVKTTGDLEWNDMASVWTEAPVSAGTPSAAGPANVAKPRLHSLHPGSFGTAPIRMNHEYNADPSPKATRYIRRPRPREATVTAERGASGGSHGGGGSTNTNSLATMVDSWFGQHRSESLLTATTIPHDVDTRSTADVDDRVSETLDVGDGVVVMSETAHQPKVSVTANALATSSVDAGGAPIPHTEFRSAATVAVPDPRGSNPHSGPLARYAPLAPVNWDNMNDTPADTGDLHAPMAMAPPFYPARHDHHHHHHQSAADASYSVAADNDGIPSAAPHYAQHFHPMPYEWCGCWSRHPQQPQQSSSFHDPQWSSAPPAASVPIWSPSSTTYYPSRPPQYHYHGSPYYQVQVAHEPPTYYYGDANDNYMVHNTGAMDGSFGSMLDPQASRWPNDDPRYYRDGGSGTCTAGSNGDVYGNMDDAVMNTHEPHDANIGSIVRDAAGDGHSNVTNRAGDISAVSSTSSATDGTTKHANRLVVASDVVDHSVTGRHTVKARDTTSKVSSIPVTPPVAFQQHAPATSRDTSASALTAIRWNHHHRFTSASVIPPDSLYHYFTFDAVKSTEMQTVWRVPGRLESAGAQAKNTADDNKTISVRRHYESRNACGALLQSRYDADADRVIWYQGSVTQGIVLPVVKIGTCTATPGAIGTSVVVPTLPPGKTTITTSASTATTATTATTSLSMAEASIPASSSVVGVVGGKSFSDVVKGAHVTVGTTTTKHDSAGGSHNSNKSKGPRRKCTSATNASDAKQGPQTNKLLADHNAADGDVASSSLDSNTLVASSTMPDGSDMSAATRKNIQKTLLASALPVQSNINTSVSSKVTIGLAPMIVMIRGLPGSGKTDLALRFAEECRQLTRDDTCVAIISLDQRSLKVGTKEARRYRIKQAHDKCRSEFQDSVNKRTAVIVLDLVFAELSDIREYAVSGISANYRIRVLEPPTPWRFNVQELARNSRNSAPPWIIHGQLMKWQPIIKREVLFAGHGQTSAGHGSRPTGGGGREYSAQHGYQSVTVPVSS